MLCLYVFPLSFLSSVFPPSHTPTAQQRLIPVLRPAAAAAAAAGEERTDVAAMLQQQHFLPVISDTFTVRSRAARKLEHFSFLLVRRVFGQVRPLDYHMSR